MELLDLPAEMVGKIIEAAVIARTLDQAIMLRLVCKRFDVETIRALCTTETLENPGSKVKLKGQRLLSEYLIARTLADQACKHQFSRVVHDAIDFILKERPQDEAQSIEYVRALCTVAVRTYSHWSIKETMARFECSAYENALAATTCLGTHDLFQKLIKAGVRHRITVFGRALTNAGRRGDFDMTRLILEKSGVSPYDVRKATFAAIGSGQLAIARLLLDRKYRAQFIVPSSLSYTGFGAALLRRAGESGHYDTIQFVVQCTTLGNLPDSDEKREFILGQPELGRKLSMRDAQNAVLSGAVKNGHLEVARAAFHNGADICGHSNYDNFTRNGILLEKAVRNGHEEVVRLLTEKGAKAGHLPALRSALRGGWLRIAQILIENGAKVNPVARSYRDIPLMIAVQRGDASCLQLLLDNGADLNTGLTIGERKCGPTIGKNAYSYATSRGYTTIMRILVEHGVDV